MATVETVTGPIDADQLGTTLIHEHLIYRDEAVATWWPHVGSVVPVDPPRACGPEELHDIAMASARAVVERGVRTICEPTGDVRRSRRRASRAGSPRRPASRSSPAPASTPTTTSRTFFDRPRRRRDGRPVRPRHRAGHPGHRDQGRVPQVRRRRARRDREHREGPPRGRARQRPHRRADHGPLAPRHPDRVRAGRDLRGGGRRPVEGPDRAHRRHRRPRLHRAACSRRASTSASTATGSRSSCRSSSATRPSPALLERGYADRMFLSQDYCATLDWYPAEVERAAAWHAGAAKGWSMTLVFEEVIPALREAGMTDEQLETMMVENPKRWLAADRRARPTSRPYAAPTTRSTRVTSRRGAGGARPRRGVARQPRASRRRGVPGARGARQVPWGLPR